MYYRQACISVRVVGSEVRTISRYCTSVRVARATTGRYCTSVRVGGSEVLLAGTVPV